MTTANENRLLPTVKGSFAQMKEFCISDKKVELLVEEEVKTVDDTRSKTNELTCRRQGGI
jgi:hypothetical protein